MNGDTNGDWLEMDGDDYMDGDDGRERVQRLPLLTGIEAPSVTVAEQSFNPEDHLESAQPRSGMRSAFMNMANSIMYARQYGIQAWKLIQSRGAGIIGQPYAIRNAGLLTGTALLIGLTVVVDWTIRLIVINSKLSGTDSFQATVQHCFGKSGLIAISLAQWVLYVHPTAYRMQVIDSMQCFWRHGRVLRSSRRHNTKGLGFNVPFFGGYVVPLATDQQKSHHDPAYSRHILSAVALPGYIQGMHYDTVHRPG